VVAALRRAGFILTGRTNTPELGPSLSPRTSATASPATRGTPTTHRAARAGVRPPPWRPDVPARPRERRRRLDPHPLVVLRTLRLKPSRWRVPAVVPGWLGAAVEGVVARSVADSAAVLDEISGPDPLSWSNAPAPDRPFADEVGADPGQLRIGLLTRAPLDMAVDRPRSRRSRWPAGCSNRSATTSRRSSSSCSPPSSSSTSSTSSTRGWRTTRGRLRESRAPQSGRLRHRARRRQHRLFALARRLQRFSRQLVAHWGREFDLLVTPAMAIEPPLAGTVLAEAHATPDATPLDVVSMAVFCAPFNVSGQPAMSLPLHWSESGLPIGVQVVGGRGRSRCCSVWPPSSRARRRGATDVRRSPPPEPSC